MRRPNKQAGASIEFVDTVATYLRSTEEQNFVAWCRTRITNVMQGKEPDVDVSGVAIACYDHYLADEIMTEGDRTVWPSADRASEYFRAVPYGQTLPLVVGRSLARAGYDPPLPVIIGLPEHIETYTADAAGKSGMLTPTLAFFLPDAWNNPKSWPYPPLGVARQVLYRSLLRCGMNPLIPALPEQCPPPAFSKKRGYGDPEERQQERDLALGGLVSPVVATSVDQYAAQATEEQLLQTAQKKGAAWGKVLTSEIHSGTEGAAHLFNSLGPVDFFLPSVVSNCESVRNFIAKANSNPYMHYLVVDVTLDPSSL